VLAVNVDYEKRIAAVGTNLELPVPREKILESLQSIGYRGEFTE
jgi:hypothetical protein